MFGFGALTIGKKTAVKNQRKQRDLSVHFFLVLVFVDSNKQDSNRNTVPSGEAMQTASILLMDTFVWMMRMEEDSFNTCPLATASLAQDAPTGAHKPALYLLRTCTGAVGRKPQRMKPHKRDLLTRVLWHGSLIRISLLLKGNVSKLQHWRHHFQHCCVNKGHVQQLTGEGSAYAFLPLLVSFQIQSMSSARK